MLWQGDEVVFLEILGQEINALLGRFYLREWDLILLLGF